MVDLTLPKSNVQLDQGALHPQVPPCLLLSEEPHTPELVVGVLAHLLQAHRYNLLPLTS